MSAVLSLPTYVAQVVRTQGVTPRMRRVTVGGEDLARFQPIGPDQFLYLLLAPPEHPEKAVGTDFTWSDYQTLPDELKPAGAYYTVRHHRPHVSEIDLDMVLHEDPGGEGGHAGRWAASCTPGDRLALWGPRLAYEPPSETGLILLFADETGLPALSAILESLQSGQRAMAFVEIADKNEQQPIDSPGDVELQWLHREGRPAGTVGLLPGRARDLARPEGQLYVWGGGESREMTKLRTRARTVWRVPKERVSLTAYWRRQP